MKIHLPKEFPSLPFPFPPPVPPSSFVFSVVLCVLCSPVILFFLIFPYPYLIVLLLQSFHLACPSFTLPLVCCLCFPQLGFRTFLGITPTVCNWSQASDECSLLMETNPLTDFVELPDDHRNLYYSNVICGVLRGALEMVSLHEKFSAQFVCTSACSGILVCR